MYFVKVNIGNRGSGSFTILMYWNKLADNTYGLENWNNIIHIHMLLTLFHYFIHSNYPEIRSSYIHHVSKRYLIISLMSVLTCTASKNRCTSHSLCISHHILPTVYFILFFWSYPPSIIIHNKVTTVYWSTRNSISTNIFSWWRLEVRYCSTLVTELG